MWLEKFHFTNFYFINSLCRTSAETRIWSSEGTTAVQHTDCAHAYRFKESVGRGASVDVETKCESQCGKGKTGTAETFLSSGIHHRITNCLVLHLASFVFGKLGFFSYVLLSPSLLLFSSIFFTVFQAVCNSFLVLQNQISIFASCCRFKSSFTWNQIW